MEHSVVDCDRCGNPVMEGRNERSCGKCKAYCGTISKWKWVTSEEHEALLREEFSKSITTFKERDMWNIEKTLKTATNVELLNKLIQNEIPEFDGTIENRNTFIKDGKIMQYLSNGSVLGMDLKLVEIRDCTERDIKIWEAYKDLLKALQPEVV